jgi:hypothetical protein
MRGFSGSTVVEQPAASKRSQPVRQTRTNPARTASNVAQTQGGALAQQADDQLIENPGFFPTITHFTDSITALPKEMTRHYTMLKEVDAKIYGPEAQLGLLLNECLRAPPPPPQTHHHTIKPSEFTNARPIASLNASASVVEATASSRPAIRGTHGQLEPSDWARRNHFHMMRQTMAGMLATLDEKNHVLNTAIDGLDKQLKRCNSSYPHIEDEISEEARLGSMTHWAYTDKTAEKKGMIGAERTRRAANNAAAQAALHEAEGAAVRSNQRREAVADRKKNSQYLDSDFDDTRAGKRGQASSKGRKAVDAAVGLGIVNGAAPPPKRRKVEKPPIGSLPQGKAMASVYGDAVGNGRGVVGSPRDLSVNDGGKKKGRGGAVAVNGSGRRRLVHDERMCRSCADPPQSQSQYKRVGGQLAVLGLVTRSRYICCGKGPTRQKPSTCSHAKDSLI